MKRAALYVRVSTEEQRKHGLSVDNQIVELKKYCSDNGIKVYKIYNDAGISARKSYKKRPALLEMIQDCKTKKVDVVLFTRLDRFFRSVPDYYACIEQMDGVPWRAIWEDYETETSSGMFKVNIMLSVAQAEADRTSEKIKSVLEYKMQKGQYVGSIPRGYIRKNGQLYKDENSKEMMQKIFDTYLKTYSTVACLKVAASYGWKPAPNTMRNMLSNKIYYGVAQNTTCEPYITIEQHTTIKESFKKRTRETKQIRKYIFQGLCFCPVCGWRMRAASATTEKATYTRYKCDGYNTGHYHKSISKSERIIEKYLLAELDNLVADYNYQVTSMSPVEHQNIEKQLKSIDGKISRIKLMFENGDIAFDEYKLKIDSLKFEKSKLEVPETKTEICLPDNWRDVYAELDSEHKAQFWKQIISAIYVSPDEIEVKFL